MSRLALLALTMAMITSCTKPPTVYPDFKVGDCVHQGAYTYKVTVVGNFSYGLLHQGYTHGKLVNKFYTITKQDFKQPEVVLTDCVIDMKKKNEEYLNSHR